MSKPNKKNKAKRSRTLTAAFVLLFVVVGLVITLALFTSLDEVTNRFEAGKVDIVLTESEWNPNNAKNIVPNTTLPKNPTVTNKDKTVNTYVFLKVSVPYDNDKSLVIEKANPDENAGSVLLSNNSKNPLLNVPIYKFVATGKKADGSDGTAPDPQSVAVTGSSDQDSLYEQAVNPGWKIVSGYPKTENGRIVYVYAHVGETVESANHLQPLLPGTTAQYPLFNKITLLNFRERTADTTNNITAFPTPGKDYNIYIEAFGIQANYLKANNSTSTNPQEVWAMIDSSYTYTP